MPARRRVANRPSRNWTGMSRRRAISPIGTGPDDPLRASSASARTAYGDLEVMVSNPRASLDCPDGEGRPAYPPLAAAARADGADLLPVGTTRPVDRPRHLGPRPAE